MAKKKSGLGKGIDAIFMENETESRDSVVVLGIDEITPNRSQPRTEFDAEALSELTESIRVHGVLQPILVRPLIAGGYQIVAGERRYRASLQAGLSEIPAIIRELDDKETMEIALIENLQRKDLTPVEEALGYDSLMKNHGFTQEQVAESVGKSRSAVANALRLLNLPKAVLDLMTEGRLSAGHARALVGIESEEAVIKLANEIVDNGLSVRAVESLAKNAAKKKEVKKTDGRKAKKPTYFAEVEMALSENMGRRVVITPAKNGAGGTISIDFYSDDELKMLANRIAEAE
ncbi:MAG: ParB/RepB/Spo0J family partition protein [Clostridia bacterium]|nr:ParB/RepB/Spo0J family partition protein [Clostridia bacterium]